MTPNDLRARVQACVRIVVDPGCPCVHLSGCPERIQIDPAALDAVLREIAEAAYREGSRAGWGCTSKPPCDSCVTASRKNSATRAAWTETGGADDR